jgi:hypothetical protein
MSTAEPSPYYRAVTESNDALEEALGHVRAEQDAGRLTTSQACAERIKLLEDHLERCRELRRQHLGGAQEGTP